MNAGQSWKWNEFQQVGADYTDLKEVAEYDRRHAQFRDVEAENRLVLATLDLPAGAHVLDIGSGTGHFVRAAARVGLRPTAVDISQAMLDYSRQEAEKEGLSAIDHIHAGFLSLDFPEATFDAIHTSAALHHLPDVWKAVALGNIQRILKPGSQFLLRDVVFDWGEDSHAAYFDDAVQSLSDEMRPDMARHIAQEYSTLAWIMEGLLERAGFRMLNTEKPLPYFYVYHCQKA